MNFDLKDIPHLNVMAELSSREAAPPKLPDFKLHLAPTTVSPLHSKVLSLCSHLRSDGFNKQAEALEEKLIAFAASNSGEDLIGFAHPEGDSKVSSIGNNDLANVETIVSRHHKMVDVISKMPTGKLASYIPRIKDILIKSADGWTDKLYEGAVGLGRAVAPAAYGPLGAAFFAGGGWNAVLFSGLENSASSTSDVLARLAEKTGVNEDLRKLIQQAISKDLPALVDASQKVNMLMDIHKKPNPQTVSGFASAFQKIYQRLDYLKNQIHLAEKQTEKGLSLVWYGLTHSDYNTAVVALMQLLSSIKDGIEQIKFLGNDVSTKEYEGVEKDQPFKVYEDEAPKEDKIAKSLTELNYLTSEIDAKVPSPTKEKMKEWLETTKKALSATDKDNTAQIDDIMKKVDMFKSQLATYPAPAGK